jgi:hypothetical protein
MGVSKREVFKELRRDRNFAPRQHRCGELFEALSFTGRKGSKLGPRFQFFQEGFKEFHRNSGFIFSVHGSSFMMLRVTVAMLTDLLASVKGDMVHPRQDVLLDPQTLTYVLGRTSIFWWAAANALRLSRGRKKPKARTRLVS